MKKIYSTMLAGLLSVSSFLVSAENYALIMGISDYQIQPLAGVKRDFKTAMALAKSMNIPSENITLKKDKALTLDGLRTAISKFEKKITKADKVFIYFSGHGTSYAKAGAKGVCEKAIVTQDMKTMSKDELHEKLTKIANKAGKTFVFLDTCFSGGMVVNGKGIQRHNDTESPTIKFVMSSGEDSCAEAGNYSPRALRDFDIEDARATPNYYLLASAAQNEFAIDGGEQYGGIATTAFASCTNPEKGADINGDSIITLQEAKQCAQQMINQKIAQWKEQNPNFPFTSQTITEGSGPGGNVPIAFQESGAVVGTVTSQATINSMALLETIQQSADATHIVSIQPTKKTFTIGVDYLEMTVTSSKPGYLTIFSVGSSGKIFQLFPNAIDSNNKIKVHEKMQLPRQSWRLPANGPAGADRFLALVSSTPNIFQGIGVPAGPFSKIENNEQGAKGLVRRLSSPVNDCKSRERDFGVESSECTNSYGAGVMDVIESY